MTQTNPEQWALDLLADIIDIGGLGGPCSEADCVECGKVALKIQAAFAEREARLVALLERAQENMPGCYIHWHDDVTAALKDRTHG